MTTSAGKNEKTPLAAARNGDAEERQFRHELWTLLEVHNALTTAPTVVELCRRAVELGHTRLGLDRLSLWFVGATPLEIFGSFGIDEQGKLRDERHQRSVLTADSVTMLALADSTSVTMVSGEASITARRVWWASRSACSVRFKV